MSFDKKTNIKKYTKKHLKKYPFCTKMKINIKRDMCPVLKVRHMSL